MLSIIISSYQPHYFTALEKNIAETIGVPYEIIKIDNPGLMGICEAYNKGGAKAQYEYLLFLHEDVSFDTKNWGEKLTAKLSVPSTGVIGVAGSIYVPAVPYAWWDMHSNSFLHLTQYNGSSKIRTYTQNTDKEVVSLDGVFLACRKNTWIQHPFNDKIKGFHGYDIDFSVRIAELYSNYVISTIDINHYSEGNMDKNWFSALIEYRSFIKPPSRQKTDKKKEFFFYEKFRSYLAEFEFPENETRKLLLKYNLPKNIGYKAAIKNFFV